MRSHIAKSLQTRCKAIQNAVRNYNIAAEQMSPTRPSLDWSKASHYAFLEDFELLHNTRHDIRSKPWADPVVRSTMKQASRIKRAKEEIENCNFEIRRLFTHILDENKDLRELDERLDQEGDAIVGAVNEYSIRRRRANAFILTRVFDTFNLIGYSGEKTPGLRIGRAPSVDSLQDHSSVNQDGFEDEDEDENELDEENAEDRHGIVEYMIELSVN